MGFDNFYWRGEPITDIEQWAKDRGEEMVEYKLTEATVYGPIVSYGSMPESFFNSLMTKDSQKYERLNDNRES